MASITRNLLDAAESDILEVFAPMQTGISWAASTPTVAHAASRRSRAREPLIAMNTLEVLGISDVLCA